MIQVRNSTSDRSIKCAVDTLQRRFRRSDISTNGRYITSNYYISDRLRSPFGHLIRREANNLEARSSHGLVCSDGYNVQNYDESNGL